MAGAKSYSRAVKSLPIALLLLVFTFSLGMVISASAADAPAIEGVEWKLVALDGKPAAAEGRGPITLKIEGKKASGFSGVNRYFGSCERDGEKLKFGALAGTKMAGPREANAAETAYLAALAATTQFRMDGEALELLNEGKVLARFTKEGPKSK
jgi:heat shock protein HslJ